MSASQGTTGAPDGTSMQDRGQVHDPTQDGTSPAPATRRAARARRRDRPVPRRTSAVVALATSALLVAAVATAGVQLHASRERAADEAADRAAALSLAVDVAAAEDEFLTTQQRRAVLDASARSRDWVAEQLAAAQAAAEAARLAEEQAAAAAQAEADRLAQEQADADAAAAAPAAGTSSGSGTTNPGIAGWVDGRPVDADGNIPWVTSVPTADGDGSNGHMPASAMCRITWGTDQLGFAQYLRCDASDALTALNDAFRARFGASIDLDLTYRSYADQVAMKAAFGGLAATPGTSSHGTGTALDVQEWASYGFGSERYTWLVENGPTYGWYAPARVREGQPYAEYWHFEYGPGRTS